MLFALAAALGLAYQAGMLSPKSSGPAEELAITVSSRRVDFGTVPVQGSAMRQLVVRNDGPNPIRAQVSVEGGVFSVSPRDLILHPGISSRISIELSAAHPGPLDDELRIHWVDGKAAPVVVTLSGEADAGLSEEPEMDDAPTREQLAATALPLDGTGSGHAPGTVDQREHGRQAVAPVPVGAQGVSTAGTQGAAGPAAPLGAAAKRTPSSGTARVDSERRPDADGGSEQDGRSGDASATRSLGIRVQPVDPSATTPFVSISQSAPGAVPADGGATGGASTLPSKIPGAGADGLPEELPEDLDRGRGGWRDDDIFDDGDDDNALEDDGPREEPPVIGPSLSISSVSSVRLMGHTATFYPQQIPILGNQSGGPIGLTGRVEFPQVPLAFGESMLFTQLTATSGAFDPLTGTVTLQVQLQAVDADGDAAPLMLNLTTGTAVNRGPSGLVVALTGTPRVPESGVLRLVAIEKIPSGYKNGAEEQLAVFEILASLSFGELANSTPRSDAFGRIGG